MAQAVSRTQRSNSNELIPESICESQVWDPDQSGLPFYGRRHQALCGSIGLPSARKQSDGPGFDTTR